MYNAGDAVVYSSYGVCVITAIEDHDFSSENVEYYVLRPVSDNKNKFYVPTDNEALKSRMRSVCSRSEVEELISEMPREDMFWIEDESRRKEEYRRIIDSGDRRKIIGLIKTLYIHGEELAAQHKKLRSSDERFLHEAENMLYDEFAYALRLNKDEVLPYIRQHI